MKSKTRIRKTIVAILSLILIFLIGCTADKVVETNQNDIESRDEETNVENEPKDLVEPEQISQPTTKEEQPKTPKWKERDIAIAGKYADADIIELDNVQYRMYYSEEPEVMDFKGRVYSSISSDGKNWAQENGVRKEWATFPSVIKFDDGKYRMYFQNQGIIKSAISTDGLSWTDETGTRIDNKNNAGLALDDVAAPTVMKINDGYIMVYRGTINERYPSKVPNNNMQLLLWAASKDGLVFEKKGIALDSRNEMFQGLLDGPEIVKWDDEIRVYFWSYKGIYYIIYANGEFSKDAVFDYTTNNNALNQFPENPPGDPTLAKINGRWIMYYGQHTKGVYYAEQED